MWGAIGIAFSILGGAPALYYGGRWLYRRLFSKNRPSSAVHQRLVEELPEIERHLSRVVGYLQVMTSSVVFEGERPEEHPTSLQDAINQGVSQFSALRLLLPVELTNEVDQFFTTTRDCVQQIGFAKHPTTPNGEQRAAYWTRAKAIAWNELPARHETIRTLARDAISGKLV